jgi:branched-subunit amino acid permease
VIVSFVLFLKARKELKIKEKQTGKKWLFEDNYSGTNAIPLINFSAIISNSITSYVLKNTIWNREYSIIASAILVFIAFYIYIQLKIIPKKVSEELEKTYPEYKFVKS